MPISLIDGVSASGKSIALKNIQNIYTETIPNYSKLIITEHFTERHFEGKEISKIGVEKHIESVLKTVLNFKEFQNNNRFSKKSNILTVYIERLLLTFFSRQIIDESTFTKLEPIFSALDCKHYLLTIPNEKFEERLSSSLKIRNEFWSKYVNDKLGGLSGAITHFQKQQDDMLRGNELLSKYMKTEVIRVEDVNSDFFKKIL